jgi:hypothetical protein
VQLEGQLDAQVGCWLLGTGCWLLGTVCRLHAGFFAAETGMHAGT